MERVVLQPAGLDKAVRHLGAVQRGHAGLLRPLFFVQQLGGDRPPAPGFALRPVLRHARTPATTRVPLVVYSYSYPTSTRSSVVSSSKQNHAALMWATLNRRGTRRSMR